ncbi:MAG: GNAT family N-acetyltransferase [Candidatus Cloacimonadaceae bacterium]|nr:GNAT family N-acetyltransferase [Candidatus Cloacimonadaceae bacterium]MDP3113652.1 GNAT family N-acetyltransferase [Candidatus Cloacimonadaceae bacterium]
MNHSIRLAKPEDANAIAKVHIQSWRETYPGIMPQKKIASLNIERGVLHWQNAIETSEAVFVALVEERVVGFVSGGKNRENSDCETGIGNACESELTAMYLLEECQGHGIGRALFEAFSAKMRSLGYKSMVSWCAEKNPATHFYQWMGGELVDRRIMIICEENIPVVAYRYWL